MRKLPLLLAATVLAACSQTHFKSSAAGETDKNDDASQKKYDPQGTNTSSTSNGGSQASETFLTRAEQGKMDMVWTIDNSDSMSEEAAHIRNNFQSFIGDLGQFSDFRLAVISKMGPAAAVDAAYLDLSKSNKPVNHKVESTNLVALAASASCARESTEVTTAFAGKICHQSLNGEVEDFPTVNAVRGALVSDFFRPNVKRVYVFVSDDNARGFDERGFLSALRASNAPETKIFAFRGIVSRSRECQVYGLGAVYDALTKATGGIAYDICEREWSTNFSDFKNNLIKLSDAGFPLKQNAKSVSQVLYEGKALPSNSYRLYNNQVYLSEGIIKAPNHKVEISYQY